MFETNEIKSVKNNCNSHVGGQFRIADSFKKGVKSSTWPLAFNSRNVDRDIFPESWPDFPVSRRFYK